LNEKIRELEDARKQFMKNIQSYLSTEKEIQNEIKTKKRKYETQSMSAKEE